MIRKICANCGARLTGFRAVLASQSFPQRCLVCRSRQYRSHRFTGFLASFGLSVGVFASILVFMGRGLNAVVGSLGAYLLLLFLSYLAECFAIDLKTFAKDEEESAQKRSRRNTLFVAFILLVGVVMYAIDWNRT